MDLTPPVRIELKDPQVKRAAVAALGVLEQQIPFPVPEEVEEYRRFTVSEPVQKKQIIPVETLQK